DLSTKQAAFLAMLIPSPIRRYSYFQKKELTEWAHKRINQILRIMNRMGFINESTYQTALGESLSGETPLLDPTAIDELLGETDLEIYQDSPVDLLSP